MNTTSVSTSTTNTTTSTNNNYNKPLNNDDDDGDGEIVFMAEQSVHDIVQAKFAEAVKAGNMIEL